MKRQDTPRRAASPSRGQELGERLDSWKEIAQYLRRGLRTVQRWERSAGLPVRRVAPGRSAVYAFREDLDAWWRKQPVDLTGASNGDQPRREPPSTQGIPTDLTQSPDSASSSPHGAMPVRPFLSQSHDFNPESAAAHADLAVYFFTLVVVGLLPPSEGMPAARAAAQRSIELGPPVPHAHALSAIVAALYDYDWREAARRFDAALLGNAAPSVRFLYAAFYLSPLGRHQDALAEVRRALVDEPLYLLGRATVAMELCSLGQAEEGVHELEQILAIDPRCGPACGLLGRERILSGRVDDALTLAERAYAAVPQHPNAIGFLAGMLQRTGDRDRSRQLLDSLERANPWAVPRARAEFAFAFVDIDAAVASMAGAVENRDPGVWLLLSGTFGNLIRASEGWRRLAVRMNVPVD